MGDKRRSAVNNRGKRKQVTFEQRKRYLTRAVKNLETMITP